MRVGSILALGLIIICQCAEAQQKCSSFEYRQQALLADPALSAKVSEIEAFIKQKQATASFQRQHLPLITIPVVVHVLYNNSDQNIPDQIIARQLAMMNACFRRLNADSVNTPSRFQGLAADCDIEFKLAISDPQKRPTTGIIRKYTSVTKWMSDDKMKFASSGGDDAWDSNNYLNLWICNLGWIQGYASFPGGDAAKDGIVMNYDAFKWQKTTVHEAGHWLGLRHVWGDEYCGDDLVDDTPKQGSATNGCPTGFRSSCSNGELGDMYMNYMDVTSSECVNLFTEGQKKRMRAVLDPGGVRNSLLTSYALLPPTNNEIPVPEEKPEEQPKVSTTNVFPNPAIAEITIDVSDNTSWIGNTVQITSVQGTSLMQVKLTAKTTTANISSLKPGIYFITAKKEDGASIKQKLIKM
jgi:hypothetical protein